MTAAHGYPDLHDLVDQLTPVQASAVRAVVWQLIKEHSPASTAPTASPSAAPLRSLSFSGIMNAEPDLAARSEEILREEFGRRSA